MFMQKDMYILNNYIIAGTTLYSQFIHIYIYIYSQKYIHSFFLFKLKSVSIFWGKNNSFSLVLVKYVCWPLNFTVVSFILL